MKALITTTIILVATLTVATAQTCTTRCQSGWGTGDTCTTTCR